MTRTDHPMVEALNIQARACAHLGSPMYADILEGLAQDFLTGGVSCDVLQDASAKPIHDAIPLRLLAALHRGVLTGTHTDLHHHYPSVGGSPQKSLVRDVIRAVSQHQSHLRHELLLPVQTNEPARAVCHNALAHWLPTIGINEFRLLEVGASAGLTMSFDRYAFDFSDATIGKANSLLHFSLLSPDNSLPASHTPAAAACTSRIGVDITPIDITQPQNVVRLLSYVWPDQPERMSRLRQAIDITREYNHVIDTASVDAWLPQQLHNSPDQPVVVFHSIVWQYLGSDVHDSMRQTLEDFGNQRTQSAPLIWARMEPNGAMADLQVTIWNGSQTATHCVLANVGYHGTPFQWLLTE